MSAGCRCGAEWPGTRISHCSACHHTFSSVVTFDAHRRRDAERSGPSNYVGRCVDPRDAGLTAVERPHAVGRGILVVWTRTLTGPRPDHWRKAEQ